jgi:predicted Ser/Thr protein kinase
MGALTPGVVLGGCRIDAVVGRGGMGVVYRARQLDLDRDVAVKVIAPELVEDPKSRKRFLREARVASAVEHPNVLPVHGAGVADGRAYLVMRYVAGDDLRTLVRRDGRLSPERAAAVVRQLGEALDAIHAAGYVHRDVKPQNVMIDDQGHVYLSDFGLAKHALATSGPTTSEQWVGTLDYVAPEQIRGERADARADVYALGGVLYYTLTARVPFERPTDHAKLWAHLVDEPPRPSVVRPELPPALDAVVVRAMAKDPAQRHPSAGDLGRAARAAAAGEQATVTERTVAIGDAAPGADVTTVRSPAVRAARARRRRLLLAGAATVAAATAGAVLLIGRDDGAPEQPATATRRRPRPPRARASATRSAASASGRAPSRSPAARYGCSASASRGSRGSMPTPGSRSEPACTSAAERLTS